MSKFLYFDGDGHNAMTFPVDRLLSIDQLDDTSVLLTFEHVLGTTSSYTKVDLTVDTGTEKAVMKDISEAIAFGKDQFIVVADSVNSNYINSSITAVSVDDSGANNNGLTAGSGITAGGAYYKSWTEKNGNVIKTSILMDLTGLASGDAADDIIGDDGGVANSHIGQYTTAQMGTLFAVSMTALEVPDGGDPDINLVFADEANLAENTALSAATNGGTTINSGDLAAGIPVYAHAGFPAANQYFYLSNGAITEAAYTAGSLLIELYGAE